MTATPQFDVAVVGSVNIDVIVRLARRPQPGETVHGEQLSHRPGGKGANQASAAARAGARTALVAATGDDPHGARLRAGLAHAGVDVSRCTTVPGPTGTALIAVTPDGENSIVIIGGANEHLTAVDAWPAAACYLTQLEIPLDTVVAAARHAQATGARFVLNVSPAQPVSPELLRQADPVVVNVHEAALLLGAAAQTMAPADYPAALITEGARSAVVTLGAAGAAWADATGAGTVAAPSVEPVDTTGAGDAFAGALTAALARGVPMPVAIADANRAGADATRWHGAVPWD
ncbi:ribokinase [Micromonospora auratinigra]|uniref:Ribokinase n=1 Tax=Micromonospora auratinigra TaxID=261654 RepID=A0A1A8Z9N5_9ACTN|nr:ribokinase [Micromonospora auratinigra]SBT40548.1 ribokinase [Micromonospora auratinigra]